MRKARAPEMEHMDVVKLVEDFHSEDACREFLEGLRWPSGIHCPRCGGKTISRIVARHQFDCDSCRYQFSVTAGTIFNDSHLPLWKWFMATFLIVEAKKGMSAKQLQRTLGVSYRTAWYLSHRIREAMFQANPIEPLTGTVEVDETFMGGKPRYHQGNKPGVRKGHPKTMVLGAVSRGGGGVRLRVDRRQRTTAALHQFIAHHVADETVNIYTDAAPAYGNLTDKDTKHEIVNHSVNEWVRGDVHTNNIESVWSLFKRSLIGSYHHLSVKHLDSYLSEIAWRFENRKNDFLFRDTLRALIRAQKMPYRALIERPA